MRIPDHVLPVPTLPGAGEYVTLFDTGDGGMLSRTHYLATLRFDQDVTLLIEAAETGGDLEVINGDGSGVTIPASTPWQIAEPLLSARTRVRLLIGTPIVDSMISHKVGERAMAPISGPPL